jgi:hypothetical protein
MALPATSVPLVLSFIALAALAGCDQRPGAATSAPAHGGQPAAPATAAATTAATPAPAPDSTDPDILAWRAEEATVLKAIGQRNARNGATLAITHNGNVVLTRTDSEREAWVLTRVLPLTRNGVTLTHYEVTHHLVGEVDEPSITLFDQYGTEVDSYADWAIWRGAVAAISFSDGPYDVGSAGNHTIELRDLSGTPIRQYAFKARCNAVRWTSDTELSAICYRPAVMNGNAEEIDATITRVGPNSWRLREREAPKATLMDVENNPAAAYNETVTGVVYPAERPPSAVGARGG